MQRLGVARRGEPTSASEQGGRRDLQLRGDVVGRDEQSFEVQSERGTASLEQVGQVLGGDVARGVGREGAAADAPRTRVEGAHAGLDGGEGGRVPGVAGVVQVKAQGLRGDRGGRLREARHVLGRSHADGVGEGDLDDPESIHLGPAT